VARPVAERARSGPGAVLASAREPISPVLRGIAQGWMSAKLRALSALMRRIEAGETVGAAVRAPSVSNALDARPTREAIPPEERLPRGFGWMCAFGPNVRGDGAAFAEWLNEPWMRAKVLAAPERMAGLIGPILDATGQFRPEWFPVAAKRKAKAFLACSGRGQPVSFRIEAELEDPPSPVPGSSAGPAQPTRPAGDARDVAVDRRGKPGDDGCLVVTRVIAVDAIPIRRAEARTGCWVASRPLCDGFATRLIHGRAQRSIFKNESWDAHQRTSTSLRYRIKNRLRRGADPWPRAETAGVRADQQPCFGENR
jgi:hypothetical protein